MVETAKKPHNLQPSLFESETAPPAARPLSAARPSTTGGAFDVADLSPTNPPKAIVAALEKLGRLEADFDGRVLLPLLQHADEDVRKLAVKNIAKLENLSFLQPLIELAGRETSTNARRETVSAIGRMRRLEAIPMLERFLDDADAKVVLQAIRGLLVFRERHDVQARLKALAQHPNEHIQSVINAEFGNEKRRKAKDSSHAQSPDFLKNVLVNADVCDALKLVPDESIHLTVTSPPYYNARDYQIYRSYEEYLQYLVSIFAEVHRVTKEGRFFALNTSPVIEPRMGRQYSSKRYLIPFDIHPRLTEIGWEFIEDIVWAKPAPSAKNRNGGFYQHRKPLAYKANSVTEYVLVYRKKTDKLIDWNIDQYSDAVIEASKVRDDYEKTNLWQIAPANDKLHPAVFPKELVARIVQFYSMKGDLVFDPFGGVGTVGHVALATGRHFFLTEKDPTYFERAASFLGNISELDTSGAACLNLEQFAQRIGKNGR